MEPESAPKNSKKLHPIIFLFFHQNVPKSTQKYPSLEGEHFFNQRNRSQMFSNLVVEAEKPKTGNLW